MSFAILFLTFGVLAAITYFLNEKYAELKALRLFYKNVHSYSEKGGQHPNWKVAQEYRELLTTLQPIKNYDKVVSDHLYNVDSYLIRLSNNTEELANRYYPELSTAKQYFEMEDPLGNRYLEKIEELHINAKRHN
jgi:hypothetical protein